MTLVSECGTYKITRVIEWNIRNHTYMYIYTNKFRHPIHTEKASGRLLEYKIEIEGNPATLEKQSGENMFFLSFFYSG